MSKQIRRASSAAVEGSGMWNHANPAMGLGSLAPALVHMSKVEIKRHESPKYSFDIVAYLENRGAKLTRHMFPYYRAMVYEAGTRPTDNSDMAKNRSPLYGDDANKAEKISRAVGKLVNTMLKHYEPLEKSQLRASMELQDLRKVTVQNWKPVGWFLNSPITDAQVPTELSPEAERGLAQVAAHYGRVLSTLPEAKLSRDEMILLDSDPPDTMTGSPTFASGERTHDARLAVLSALPPPTSTPEDFIAGMEALNSAIGYPQGFIYSPVLSTRMGPLRKWLDLWIKEGSGYVSYYQALGAYNRTRYVFPAPYHVNFLLSPLYVQMSAVRKNVLGLWHDPESQTKYIAALQAQGKYAYSIDFSGMDTGMFQNIIMACLRHLKTAGFQQWTTEFFLKLYPKMGIILPDYSGDQTQCYHMMGNARPWCSGFKLTSEMDTLYGASVLLSALHRQIPTIYEDWTSGKFIFLELGDDILFTTNVLIDQERLAKDALQLWGAKLEIIQDAMFLKWFLPLDPSVPKLTRSISRFIQQTFFNEDKYDGGEGGTRPDAVMRLGLMARLDGIVNHPDAHLWWPKIYEILLQLDYVGRSSDAYKVKLKNMQPSLDEGDTVEIMKYSERVPTYFADLTERSKYEPSAAHLLRLLEEQGLSKLLNPPSDIIRTIYLKELLRRPTSADLNKLLDYTRRIVG